MTSKKKHEKAFEKGFYLGIIFLLMIRMIQNGNSK